MVDFGRLITAMVTPLTDNQQVNWDQVGPLMDYLVEEQKSNSLVICGTTGESPTLTDDEKLLLFEKTVELAQGRCKIIAGTGSNSTAHTIHLSQEAEKRGVDALLLVVPYYNRPSQEGMYQHFKAVAESVNIPVILYNVPGRTAINLDAATTIRLSHIPNIVATKDCAGIEQLTRIVNESAEGFRVYSGDDTMTLPALSVGCTGIVSVASHVVGKEMQQMITAYLNGHVAEAAKLHGKLQPIFTGLFTAPSPAPVKHALNLRNIPVGGVRLPLIALNEQEGEYIASLLS